jgi:tRNA-modifying protein YgfZ
MVMKAFARQMTEAPFYPHIRPDRAVISVGGDDALAFLHNLLTVDLDARKPGDIAYGALLTPQGKILHDVFLHVRDGMVLVDCAAEHVQALLQKLIMYRLRAKLEIKIEETMRVVVGEGPNDPRHPEMGRRTIGEASSLPVGDGGEYNHWRLQCGLADSVLDIGSGELFVHEANLDQLGAVSFTKGCYVGQEVVSRTHHRGTARNRILQLHVEGALPPKSTPILRGETRVGEMLSGQDVRGLGLIRLDRLAESDAPLRAGEIAVTVKMPNWMKL